MTRIFMTTAAVLALAAPAFAGSPAEDFGQKMKTNSATATSLIMAADKLSGDSVDERLPYGENEIVSRSSFAISVGHEQLARNMGVNAEDYSVGQLSKMYIGEYD